MFLHSYMELSRDSLDVDGDIPAKRVLKIGAQFGRARQKQRLNFVKRKSRKEKVKFFQSSCYITPDLISYFCNWLFILVAKFTILSRKAALSH